MNFTDEDLRNLSKMIVVYATQAIDDDNAPIRPSEVWNLHQAITSELAIRTERSIAERASQRIADDAARAMKACGQ